MLLQCFRQFIQCRAGGHHIIHNDDVLARKINPAFEGMANVLAPRLPRQAGLRRGIDGSQASVQHQWQGQSPGQRPRDFHCLIESPFAQARGGHRYRQQQVALRLSRFEHQRRKKIGHRQSMVVLQRLHQTINRKAVNQRAKSTVEMGHMFQALAANFPGRCR